MVLSFYGTNRSRRRSRESRKGRKRVLIRERRLEGDRAAGRRPKPRRKHIYALDELVILEVLEPKGLVSCNCINRGDILGSGVFTPDTAR